MAVYWTEPANTVFLVLQPEGADTSSDAELAAALRTQFDRADTLVVEPYTDTFDDVPLMATLPTPGSIVEEEHIESIDALRWTLSNGITVIAKQTDFRSDEVVFTAFSPGGHSLVADTDHVSAVHAEALASAAAPVCTTVSPWTSCSQASGFRCPRIFGSCSKASAGTPRQKTWRACSN